MGMPMPDMPKKPLTLKDAQQSGKLDQFIKEREHLTGDPDQFDACLTSMTKTKKPKRGTSPPEPSED